jgi:hypothetical protein
VTDSNSYDILASSRRSLTGRGNHGAEALTDAASRVERALGGADPNATDAAITDLHAVLAGVCSTLDERLPALAG